MRPNQLCWCRSGKKFKKCHHRRAEQEPVNIFDVDAEMRVLAQQGYCSHPEASAVACSSGISNAHTIQRRGALAAIAEEGHVLTVRPTLQGMIEHDGKPPPRLIGIGRASVFPGFCARHDSALFKSIEGTDIQPTKEQALLLAYRAIAYERFAKGVQLESSLLQRESDKGQPFWKQVLIQQYHHPYEWGIRLGLRDVEAWKSQYDRVLQSGVYDDFHFFAARFAAVLPVVTCTAFHVEVDLQGNVLQKLGRGNAEFEHVAMNIVAFGSNTIVVLGWVGSNLDPAAKFVRSFEETENDRKADAVVRMAFELTDNIYIRPSWWNGLDKADRSNFMQSFWSGTPVAKREKDCLVDRATSYASAGVVSVHSG